MSKVANLTGALVILGLTGCVATSPNWDASFGDAARTLAAQQVIAPDASLNSSPVTGVDGKAALGAMEHYRESFAVKEEKAPAITLQIK